MSVNGFTIGRDIAADFNFPQGAVRFSNITGFDKKQMTTPIESKGIDGEDLFGDIPSGWQGTLTIDRQNANMDIAFDALETLYYSGQNIPGGSITETITEPNGQITVWLYTKVSFKYDEAGNAQGDAKVTQSMSWRASRRRRLQ